MRKTLRQKFEGAPAPHTTILKKAYCGAPAGSKLFIASPGLVDEYARSIPRGRTMSVPDMRRDLARAHGADVTCPTSTGIFLRIAAEAALEDMAAGAPVEMVMPFWRLIEPESPAAAKLSCGAAGVARLRRAEAGAT